MPRIKPVLLGHPDRSLVTLLTILSPLTSRLYLYATGKKGEVVVVVVVVVVAVAGIERGGRNQFRL
jgi:hypothetical protein